MEILGKQTEKNTLYIAVLALVVLGLALVLSTWRMLRQQEEAGLEHLALTARSILQAVDSSLRRGPAHMGRGMGMGQGRFNTETREFFQDLQTSGDVLFAGIIDDKGNRFLGPRPPQETPLDLPPEAMEALRKNNRWHGVAKYGDTVAYVAARRLQIMRFRMMRDGERPPRPDQGEANPHHGMSIMRPDQAPAPGAPRPPLSQDAPPPGAEQAAPETPQPPELFLVVALDMDKHQAVYQAFRRTALFQTAYILAAALFIWALAARFLSRRKLAGKAAYLERFQARLLDNLPDGLLIVDGQGDIRAANPAAHAILAGHGASSAAALAGRPITDFSLPPIAPADSCETGEDWRQLELSGLHLEVRCLPFHGEEESPALMVILRDRTRIRSLEKSLAEAEKLAAVGTLAAGVAHEIRNPLSALRGFAQYFAKKLAGKKPEEEYATTMVREADRLNRVVTDLLYLARPRCASPVPTQLEPLCDELETLLRFDLREKELALTRDLAATTVTADPDALKQALLNLLLNALEAMPSPDKTGSPRVITLQAERDAVKDGVWIRVADTGPGMTEEQKKQAFEPFFSTKSKGTGLGLALVHSIMSQHGGEAAIQSAPGRGCEIALFFPGAPHDKGQA